jgi:hypothetical protein
MIMNKPRFAMLVAMIMAAITSRLIPHPPNFSPVAAIALFGGAQFSSKRAAFLVPLAGLLLSDLVIGFYAIVPIVYGSFALTVCIGFWVGRGSVRRIAFASVASAVLFFGLTNFGVWAMGDWYPKTSRGLMDCYVAGIPFFGNTLLSNVFYSALLFGGLAIAENRVVRLRQSAIMAH